MTDNSASETDGAANTTLLTRITDRDLQLLKGTIRGLVGEDVETVGDFPAAGRAVRAELDALAERVATLEDRVAALGDVGAESSSKTEKHAAVLAFAAIEDTNTTKIAVTPAEVRGCTSVSRLYAYKLIEAMDEEVGGLRVREATQVKTGSGVEQKQKVLLVDYERVHASGGDVTQFTTAGGDQEDS